MSRPKNLIIWSFAHDVLLLRNALVSSKLWRTRAIIDKEMTVDPELYSTIVLLFGVTWLDCNMFNAGEITTLALFRSTRELGRPTWKCLYVVCWECTHHLGVYSNSIFIERVQLPWYLNQWKRWLLVWIIIISERVFSRKNIKVVDFWHCENFWLYSLKGRCIVVITPQIVHRTSL